ncbi:uncharacterized protein LOC123404499 [Hordeum vulgare subsp. vulgare]|uniref:uncharacterized protein LOC123404499 n=1 Tax=Hordeum vulgare subsp. vulgare TaxID=112509 RepID=UPI001D1A3D32|nr:uncharacterized protein LOC123404499 [Hordeum vulgare subsp. vulgare]XP_044954366.1 uncharacterized protein LOC123404499 [Hordeum vulgare subsp. vulgare]
MPKRRWQGDEVQPNYHDRGANKPKSIYLVLDDWHGGFTIRKLDADSPDLSEPPVFRLASPMKNHAMDFAALGSNIIATSNQCAATLVFDTEAEALAIGNPLPDALLSSLNFFVTADDMLFAFAYYFTSRPPSFEVMTTAKEDEAEHDGSDLQTTMNAEHHHGEDLFPNMTRAPHVKYITYYEDAESIPGWRTAVWELDKGFCGVACDTKIFSHLEATCSRIDLIVLEVCHEITLMCTISLWSGCLAANLLTLSTV